MRPPTRASKTSRRNSRRLTTDAAFAAVLIRLADLVGERADDVARDRAAAAAILAQVTERLEEMASYLGGLNTERQTRLDDADTLNTAVLSHVTRLSNEVRTASDLAALAHAGGRTAGERGGAGS